MMSKRTANERSCEACGDAFVFTRSEQAFFDKRGLPAPKRCDGCSESPWERRPSGDDAENPSRSPGHEAVCSACGDLTHLPFMPTDERPVYCKPCFRNR